eukprot:6486340-Prymnesium_polylepis.1
MVGAALTRHAPLRSPTHSQSSTNTKKLMPRPAALTRSLSAMLSIRAQNSLGLSPNPNGSAVAHMSLPVCGNSQWVRDL